MLLFYCCVCSSSRKSGEFFVSPFVFFFVFFFVEFSPTRNAYRAATRLQNSGLLQRNKRRSGARWLSCQNTPTGSHLTDIFFFFSFFFFIFLEFLIFILFFDLFYHFFFLSTS